MTELEEMRAKHMAELRTVLADHERVCRELSTALAERDEARREMVIAQIERDSARVVLKAQYDRAEQADAAQPREGGGVLLLEPSEEAMKAAAWELGYYSHANIKGFASALRKAYAIDRLSAASLAPATAGGGWRTMDSAPKGYPSLEEPSEWFIAMGVKEGPQGARFAIIRRCFGHGFGPWEGTGDEYYRADFFTHWQPLPEPPIGG